MATKPQPLLTSEQAIELTAVIAENIQQVSDAVAKIRDSRLGEDLIVLLLSEHSGIGRGAVRAVLQALPQLQSRFLKPAKK